MGVLIAAQAGDPDLAPARARPSGSTFRTSQQALRISSP